MTSATALRPNRMQKFVLDWLKDLPMRLESTTTQRGMLDPAQVNKAIGMSLKAGRQTGHTTLVAQILLEHYDAVAVVVDERRMRLVQRLLPDGEHDRVVMARMLNGKEKAKVIEKELLPLVGKRICVVDDASLYSEWEIGPFRCAEWDAYIELN